MKYMHRTMHKTELHSSLIYHKVNIYVVSIHTETEQT